MNERCVFRKVDKGRIKMMRVAKMQVCCLFMNEPKLVRETDKGMDEWKLVREKQRWERERRRRGR